MRRKLICMFFLSLFCISYAEINLVDKYIQDDENGISGYETKDYVVTDEETIQSIIDFSYKDLNEKDKIYKNNNYKFSKKYDPNNIFIQLESKVYSIIFDEKKNVCIFTNDGVLFKYPFDKFKIVIEKGEILEKKELKLTLKEKISYYGLNKENVMIKYKISKKIPENAMEKSTENLIELMEKKGLLKNKKQMSVYFFLPFNNGGKAYARYVIDLKSKAIKTKEISLLNITQEINLK